MMGSEQNIDGNEILMGTKYLYNEIFSDGNEIVIQRKYRI